MDITILYLNYVVDQLSQTLTIARSIICFIIENMWLTVGKKKTGQCIRWDYRGVVTVFKRQEIRWVGNNESSTWDS